MIDFGNIRDLLTGEAQKLTENIDYIGPLNDLHSQTDSITEGYSAAEQVLSDITQDIITTEEIPPFN